MSRPGRALRAAVAIAVTGSLMAACTGGGGQEPGPAGSAASEPAPRPALTGTVSSPDPRSESLQRLIDDVTADFGGQASVALHGEGRDMAAGPGDPHPAWSTMKVPVAIAALRVDPELSGVAAAAIRSSDNDAAEQLWNSLGDPAVAAAAVEQVLAEGGVRVDVPAERIRPEFSAFGQTAWSPSQQARFAAELSRIPASEPVVALMAEIDSGQAYGLGALPGTAFKGGWGPGGDGAYTVRQFGRVPTETGTVGVALSVTPGSGSFADGQVMIDRLAQGLPDVLAETAP